MRTEKRWHVSWVQCIVSVTHACRSAKVIGADYATVNVWPDMLMQLYYFQPNSVQTKVHGTSQAKSNQSIDENQFTAFHRSTQSDRLFSTRTVKMAHRPLKFHWCHDFQHCKISHQHQSQSHNQMESAIQLCCSHQCLINDQTFSIPPATSMAESFRPLQLRR